MEREMGWRIGAVGAVLRSLCLIIVMKRELSQKAKLGQSSYLPSPMVMTERTRSRIQAAEMGFLGGRRLPQG